MLLGNKNGIKTKNYKNKEKLRITRNKQRKRCYQKSQTGTHKKWTESEIAMLFNNEFTDSQLSEILERSVQGIQIKRSRIRKELEENE